MQVKPFLLIEQARTILEGALGKASADGIRMSIAIVDEGGYPLCLQRMDGAGLLTPKVALEKARTAALTRSPSRRLAERVSNDPALLRLTDYLPMPGGLPLIIDGVSVGAIGVSGATGDQVEAVGEAGCAELAAAAD